MKKVLFVALPTAFVSSVSAAGPPMVVPKMEKFDVSKTLIVEKLAVTVEPMQFVISDMTMPDLVYVTTAEKTSAKPAVIVKAEKKISGNSFESNTQYRRPRDGVRCNSNKS